MRSTLSPRQSCSSRHNQPKTTITSTIMSLVWLLLKEPHLFKCLEEHGTTKSRGDDPVRLWKDFHAVNRTNGLAWFGDGEEASIRDCLKGTNPRNGLQVAHLLPHRTSKEPALWLLCRVLGRDDSCVSAGQSGEKGPLAGAQYHWPCQRP